MPSDLFLVDTSVWLEVLPPDRGFQSLRERIDALPAADQVATTGMVRLELLGGARSQKEWSQLSEHLQALHQLPVLDEQWQQAAQMGFQLRRQGVSVPFTNILIGAVAIEFGAVLLHRDRHFDFISSSLPLQAESYLTA